jgi:RNA polymerase sigma factor (sigma-70 family)
MANGQQSCDFGTLAMRDGTARCQTETDRQLLQRFVAGQEEAAFALLVQKHGPMVWAVCQRVLLHAHDAEDAFQATFLVLVRKAGSIRKPELLGNWLYGVAYRTARKARATAARRRALERQAPAMSPEASPVDLAWFELRDRLDEALHRLPDKYRAPLVLCYLQGKTNAEAARLLGWPAGSMSARLTRARELLRERLEERRPAGFCAPLAAVLAVHAGPGQLPLELAETTVQAAVEFGGGPMIGAIAPSVQALTDSVLQGMNAARRRIMAMLLLLLLAMGLFIGLVAQAATSFTDYLPSGGPHPSSSGGCSGSAAEK